ncbi:hypothetical protein RclHR1_01550026 [Rhizophagus clarus]|uniref:DUF605-domain-containing protein n=1 Tax=Rhizophagus clarus TaxID=94130 RepID=A0A2Z6QJI5_9GLOM|nr:hypothetical protein RclHR1_01550026 [Rhizophagus clarus]GET01147.1 DUF605-domain-containing protein [Rhizophagus clarus]
MASLPSLPEELKFINPFLQRAQETRKKEPVISYYCNFLSAKLALDKGTKSHESKLFLAKLLDILEQEKKELADNEAITNEMAGEAYIENFSLKVFTIADNEDRAGKATRNTAKTFLAASLYMELLRLFGNMSKEFEDKIKYAKWKAIEITKALKEGRTPVPGPPGGEPAEQKPEYEENNQSFPGVDQFPLAQTTPDQTISGPPSSNNDNFPIFPAAPTNNNSVPNVQDLVSSFDQINIGKQAAPPLPPKVNDYTGNNNNFDNQFNQQPPPPPPNFPPSSNANFYDTHQNYQQPSPPNPPSTLTHTGFTNDYAQPHHYQSNPLPQPPHNSFLPPPQSTQNYIQPVNPPQPPQPPHQQQFPHQQPPNQQQPSYQQPSCQKPSFSAPANYNTNSYSQPPAEMEPATAEIIQKYCKFASSALDYNDVSTAVKYLNQALEALKPYHK